MKTKEIQAGVPYNKRGTIAYWGVPITLESLYAFTSYSRYGNEYLYPGKGVLVLVNNFSPASGKSHTPEDAAIAAKKIKDPGKGSIKDLVASLKKKGFALEIWLPREFQGTVADVLKEQEDERTHEHALRSERAAIRKSLSEQFEVISKDLGVVARLNIREEEEDRVTMTISDWKKMMNRVEALIQSDPLNSGML